MGIEESNLEGKLLRQITGRKMINLAIITARSGSKGVIDKNIKLLHGKPLLAYSIEAALESKMFEEVLVSTDSEKYAEIAKEYGASVPFLRSEENSGDDISSWDAVREVLKTYGELGKKFDTVALLQPTSPLREAEDIINGYRLLHEKNADSVIGVCEVEHSPLFCNLIGEDLSLQGFVRSDLYTKPRQKLPKYYRVNGALYIVKTRGNADIAALYDSRCYACIMPKEKSVDIDSMLDFRLAEIMLEEKITKKK